MLAGLVRGSAEKFRIDNLKDLEALSPPRKCPLVRLRRGPTWRWTLEHEYMSCLRDVTEIVLKAV